MPRWKARPVNTSIVCGKVFASTKYLFAPACSFALERLWKNKIIASAPAVPSSNKLPFAIGNEVKSVTMVWKFNIASRRPCAISAWYGVYAVYQPGFSKTFRRITVGVKVGW